MLGLIKKLHRHGDELLNLALILSLIRVDPDSYLGFGRSNTRHGTFHNITMGETWAEMPIEFHRSLLTNLPNTPYLHPKGVEASLVQYQEELIEDLNNLGRYNDALPSFNLGTITAYLLDESSTVNHNLSTPISPQVNPANPNPSSSILNPVGPSTSHQTFLDYIQEPPPSDTDTLDPSSSSDISVEVYQTEQ